ncbi:PTS sugar transporter subunit IIA [uncultured Novosphingobium sp.]|uniref:PTS sugar transporter subunit IIA n=1 Tax=Novosphingobium fluoreni TaxID=1391222 RepID=UPI0037495A33
MSALFTLLPEAVAIAGGTDTAVGDKASILAQLAALFARVYALDQDLVLKRVVEREELGSTGFGRQVAIPHARLPGLVRPVAAIIRLDSPVDFDSADGMPVDIVFGLLSPDGAGATHLHALAAISRMMRDERMHAALVSASGPDVIYSLLSDVIDRDAA